MNGIVRKIISTVAAAAVAFTVMTVSGAPGSVARAATTGGCDGTHTGWEMWAGGAFTSSGSYYLNNDVTLSDQITIGSGVDVTLCLNGHTVTAASNKRIFYINGGTLTLCDCNSSGNGQGILTGGNIRRRSDKDTNGGCIFVDGGTLNMNGGTISGNDGLTGGGVYVGSDSIFTMNGGKISGNSANSGGGISVSGAPGGGKLAGVFTMKGGEISSNTGTYECGGIGISGKVIFDGKINISENIMTRSGVTTSSNVSTSLSSFFSIGTDFSTDSPIGLNCSWGTSCKSPRIMSDVCNEDILNYFIADKDDEFVFWETSENKIKLAKNHTIENPDIVEPTCTEPGTETGTCNVCSQTVTSITAPALGHNWGAWTVTTPATSTQKGTETRTCNNDGTHTETREIAATGGGNSEDNGNNGNTGDNGNNGNTGDNGDNGNTEDNGNNGNSGNSESSSGGSSGSGTKTPSIAEVEQDDKSPETELANSDSELKDALLTEAERADADDITIVLRVKDSDPGADKQTVETRLASTDGFKVGQYIDVSLFKVVNGSESKLTKTNKPIKVRFEIPRELRANGRTFAVIRVHDGAATILRDLDNDSDTITIETDKFSTYALIYSDSPTAASNPYTGITTALFPTALLAAAAMLLTKRRKN